MDEEIVRLRSHIESTKATLLAGGSIGRKLDFIAQEMNREANTILSKANALEISNCAIELKTEIEKKFQNAGFTDSSNKEKTNTLYFDADITEDELKAKPYLNWILSAETANGKVNKFDVPETVEGVETTTATYFCIVKSLDYDKSPLVDGGYVEFDSVAAAEEFLASVSGKTGTDLETAFTEKSGTVSTSISEDGLNDELKAWLFDSARAAGNMEVVPSGEKAYVAYFNGSTPTWEANAESSYLEEKLENWINDLSVPYAINEKALKRIKDKPLDDATTTEA